ncbi:hypothetical protein O181_039014 [Austropuccinia psidii MF-1]|uniref:Integrase catalytic domain-containing protein n=1 Tax=Austropuccinia psidii MF-1 TaxID=1389203 RepID=A0A9Q3HE47_9BASI|nr:hypothetical protein [Austropuccinia psidii MF-1]
MTLLIAILDHIDPYNHQAGHWAPECPAQKKATNARILSQQKANVASIGAVPALEYDEDLLDSGATHSVVGDASLFTALWKTNITLSVASSHQFPVDYVSNIALKTHEGTLTIKNIKQIMQFKASDGIPPFNFYNIKICHPFSVTKAEHFLFISASQKHIHQPGDVTADDLIGPFPVSNYGKQYALVIQDIFSRLTEIIALIDKSEAKHQLRLWMIKFMNITKFAIQVVRTDNGAEFCNHYLNDYLKEKGIIHELSVPYKHHQNRQIERTNFTILEIARTSLIAANLPTSLWPYSFRNAAWIFNCTLHSDNKITPYKIVGSKKPFLFQLRVFGIKKFIFNHQAKKDLGAKTIIGYHLGIMVDSKGWLFWVLERGTVVRLARVKFDKDSYFNPKSTTHHTISKIQVDNLFDGSIIGQLNKQDSVISVLNSSNNPTEALPMTYNKAMSSLQAEEWKKAMLEGLNSMTEKKVFVSSNISKALKETPRESILSTKWVFAIKGSPERFKGWLVARGFQKIHGINFEETFAPMPTFGAL